MLRTKIVLAIVTPEWEVYFDTAYPAFRMLSPLTAVKYALLLLLMLAVQLLQVVVEVAHMLNMQKRVSKARKMRILWQTVLS
jgi:hypothetical protein